MCTVMKLRPPVFLLVAYLVHVNGFWIIETKVLPGNDAPQSVYYP